MSLVKPYAQWSLLDSIRAERMIREHYRNNRDHPLVEQNSPDIVWGRIVSKELTAAIVGSYLLVYDIGYAWCSTKTVLHELLLIRIYDDTVTTFADAVEGMKQLAELNGCAGIMTGNGVLRPGLRRLYLRQGFRDFNQAFYLEV